MIENTRENQSQECYLEIIKQLIKLGCWLEVRDKKGRTPLDIAVERSDILLVRLLLDAGADLDRSSGTSGRYERETPLHLAASTSTLEVIQFLIASGADVNVQDRRGESPVLRAAKGGRRDVLEVLKSRGADMSTRDLDGWGALAWAAWRGHKDVVGWLLEEALEDPNRTDRFGKTPLHVAAEKGSEDVVLLLLHHGADHRLKDIEGRTPADYIQSQHNSLREIFLTKYGRCDLSSTTNL